MFEANDQLAQRLLFFEHQRTIREGRPLPSFADAGFRTHSLNDEDGILLLIFAVIGMTDRRCVEIAFGDHRAANSTNLILNWGFDGLVVEADVSLADAADRFFAMHADTWLWPPRVAREWITAENVDGLIRSHGCEGEIDLFSLDIDGVDYWVWKALTAISPRVVVVEYQDIWGSEAAVTIPYSPDFSLRDAPDPSYFGASLMAFVKLGRTKGYRLVGTNRYGFNAFFVREDVAGPLLPEVDPAACLTHAKVRAGTRDRLPSARQYAWVQV